ncbi:ubiquitin-like-conjugating enzyme ATG10 [Epargyreus clarus]|uniref:ubiquitin-like-conjugating enzyme ATG10 n=1 Tax=Epargyreus clarus TaxID=520877 RepID=UPI003C2F4D87
MDRATISAEEFVYSARDFLKISDKIHDDWKIIEDTDIHKCYLKKETYIDHEIDQNTVLYKAEYIIFYNLSYGVPSFSFNVWNSSGSLLTLKEIRKMSLISIDEAQFYSVITQQEHPLLHRPYFIMHPCHTETLLAAFKHRSKNIIVTFLGLITPLLKINLPLEYGL